MKEYTVNIGGIDHTMQLSDEDAKARGLTGGKTDTKAAEQPANKSRSAQSKS